MNSADRRSSALEDALATLLRPLCRVLLRNRMSFAAFEALAKRVYVDLALTEFGIAGKKPSISRAAILSGLTRKEVQRVVSEPPSRGGSNEQYNRAARVLTGWVRDPSFADTRGRPKKLAIEGRSGFGELVRRHSGDVPVRAVLDELLRVGAVRQAEDGSVELLTRAYVPQQSPSEKLRILGTDVADLISTIDFNMEHGASEPRFQRKVMYVRIPTRDLTAFRKTSATQSQNVLERFDAWLAKHDVDDPPEGPALPRARVGVGIYYFEEGVEPHADSQTNEVAT